MKDFDNISWEENIGKYLSGNYSAQEEAALFDWIEADPQNRRTFEEFKLVWNHSAADTITLTKKDVAADWTLVQKAIQLETAVEKVKPKQSNIIPMFIRTAAAAAVILVLVLAGKQLLQNQSDQAAWTKFASEVESRHLTLPDGSQVWLNKSSSIEFVEAFEQREVRLDGEAFFEVTKDPTRPFTVLAEGSKTTVLGTRFNLNTRAADNEVALVVEEGRVAFEVISNPSSTQIINGKESAIASIEQEYVVKQLKADPNTYSYKTGQLIFDDASLAEVAKAVERHFDVDVQIANPDMEQCVLRTLLKDATLDETLETIAFILNCEVSKTNDVIYLDGSPCINNVQ